MTLPNNSGGGLRRLGAAVAALGGIAIFVGLGLGSWVCQSAGLVAAVTGVLLVQLHRTRKTGPSAAGVNGSEARMYGELPRRVGLAAWLWAIGLTLACLASFGAMYVDAACGGRWVWPVYAAAVTGVACACAWGYIAAKMGWFISY